MEQYRFDMTLKDKNSLNSKTFRTFATAKDYAGIICTRQDVTSTEVLDSHGTFSRPLACGRHFSVSRDSSMCSFCVVYRRTRTTAI